MSAKRHTTSFLLELLICLFFFLLAATICIQLFVRSYSVSEESETLGGAVLCAQTLAETFRSEEASLSSDVHYFDGDWNACGEEDAVYTAEVQITEPSARLEQADIAISDREKTIYELEVKRCR